MARVSTAKLRAQNRKLKIISLLMIVALGVIIWHLVSAFLKEDELDNPSPVLPNLVLISFDTTPFATSSSSSASMIWSFEVAMSNPSLLLDPVYVSPLYNNSSSTSLLLLGDSVALRPQSFLSGSLAVMNRSAALSHDQAQGMLHAVVGVRGVLKKDGAAVSWVCPAEFSIFFLRGLTGLIPFKKCLTQIPPPPNV